MTAPHRLLAALLAASGFCALGYELLWTRWAGLALGTFGLATVVVTATFMAGLALGNWAFGAAAARRSPAGAVRLYGRLEAGLALLAAASPFVLPRAQSTWLCALALLPPTVLMGGTLPAAVQALSISGTAGLARAYAFNTLGAAAGPVIAAFALLPVLGLTGTLRAVLVLNVSVAAAAFLLARRFSSTAPEPLPARPAHGDRLPLWLAAGAGFLALAFEIVLTRLLVLTITRSSVYGFAMTLSAFLIGIAAGAWALRRRPPATRQRALLGFAGALTLVWVCGAATSGWALLLPLVFNVWVYLPPFAWRAAFDGLVTVALLLPLTASFGYALPALLDACADRGTATAGRLVAANTLGAVAGTIIAGLVLIPLLGLERSLTLLGALALALAALAAVSAAPPLRRWVPAGAVGLIALTLILPQPDPVMLNAGLNNRALASVLADVRLHRTTVRFQRDSLAGRIALWWRPPGQLTFRIDGMPNASLAAEDMLTQVALAHLPALLHPRPRRALVIGLGMGVTAGSLALHRDLEELHVAEINPAQPELARSLWQFNGDVLRDPRMRLHLDDARHWLRASPLTYDLISSDPANLYVAGMVNLYTREYYELIRSRLTPGGVFLQWMHYYQIGSGDLRGVIRTFQDVFPHASVWMHMGGEAFLLATPEPVRLDLADWERRLAASGFAADLARGRIEPPVDLAGLYLWGEEEARRFAGDARVCTDDRPYLEFTTPRVEHSGDRTMALATGMGLFGPVAPAPLIKEDVRRRIRLGELALGWGHLARARAEFTRALALAPSRALRARLADVDAAEARLRVWLERPQP
ncbi:MAG: fused MFS/spermidine synthase [bacterium]